jgi:hypothetical protein
MNQIEFITKFNCAKTTLCKLTPNSREAARQKIAADTANFLALGKTIYEAPATKFQIPDNVPVQILTDGTPIQSPNKRAA